MATASGVSVSHISVNPEATDSYRKTDDSKRFLIPGTEYNEPGTRHLTPNAMDVANDVVKQREPIQLPSLPAEAASWRPYFSGPQLARLYAANPVLRPVLRVVQHWPFRGRKSLIRAACRLLGGLEIEMKTTWGGRFQSPFHDTFLLQGVFGEPAETAVVHELVQPEMVAIDVGANRGWYTLLFSKLVGPQGQVYALEPEPAMFRILNQNVAINGFAGNVSTFPLAASDICDKAMMQVNSAEPEISRLVPKRGAFSSADVSVDAVTLDRFAESHKLGRIDFIKVDVEGAEAKVLAGARGILERCQPLLLVEALDRNLRRYGNSASQLSDALRNHGYRCFVVNLCEGPLPELQKGVRPLAGPNWLCVPQGRF